jgi:hypothetical protein
VFDNHLVELGHKSTLSCMQEGGHMRFTPPICSVVGTRRWRPGSNNKQEHIIFTHIHDAIWKTPTSCFFGLLILRQSTRGAETPPSFSSFAIFSLVPPSLTSHRAPVLLFYYKGILQGTLGCTAGGNQRDGWWNGRNSFHLLLCAVGSNGTPSIRIVALLWCAD